MGCFALQFDNYLCGVFRHVHDDIVWYDVQSNSAREFTDSMHIDVSTNPRGNPHEFISKSTVGMVNPLNPSSKGHEHDVPFWPSSSVRNRPMFRRHGGKPDRVR